MSRANSLPILLIMPERRLALPRLLPTRDAAFKKALFPPNGARRIGRHHLATVNQVGLFAMASLDNRPGPVFAITMDDGRHHGFRGRVILYGDVGHGPAPCPVDAAFALDRINWAPIGIDLVVHNAPVPDCPACKGTGRMGGGVSVLLSNDCDVCGGSGKKPKLQ